MYLKVLYVCENERYCLKVQSSVNVQIGRWSSVLLRFHLKNATKVQTMADMNKAQALLAECESFLSELSVEEEATLTGGHGYGYGDDDDDDGYGRGRRGDDDDDDGYRRRRRGGKRRRGGHGKRGGYGKFFYGYYGYGD